jgi:hypothetical protein
MQSYISLPSTVRRREPHDSMATDMDTSRRGFGAAGDDTTIQHVSRDGLRRQGPYEDIFAVLAEDCDNSLEHAVARRIDTRVVSDTAAAGGTKMYVHREWGTRRADGFNGLIGKKVYQRLAVQYEHQPSAGTSFSTFGFGSKAIFHYYTYLLYVVAAEPREVRVSSPHPKCPMSHPTPDPALSLPTPTQSARRIHSSLLSAPQSLTPSSPFLISAPPTNSAPY